MALEVNLLLLQGEIMRRFVIAAATLCAATAVFAHDVKIGDIKIDDAWARTGQPGQVSAAYFEVKNKGAADKIVSAHCDCAKATELHDVKMVDGAMKMVQIPSMDIPAKGELKLKPGSYHIMLINLNRPLVAGETLPIKVKFEKSGEVTVQAKVKDKAAHMGH
jgi:copper(I)-binding protein